MLRERVTLAAHALLQDHLLERHLVARLDVRLDDQGGGLVVGALDLLGERIHVLRPDVDRAEEVDLALVGGHVPEETLLGLLLLGECRSGNEGEAGEEREPGKGTHGILQEESKSGA